MIEAVRYRSWGDILAISCAAAFIFLVVVLAWAAVRVSEDEEQARRAYWQGSEVVRVCGRHVVWRTQRGELFLDRKREQPVRGNDPGVVC